MLSIHKVRYHAARYMSEGRHRRTRLIGIKLRLSYLKMVTKTWPGKVTFIENGKRRKLWCLCSLWECAIVWCCGVEYSGRIFLSDKWCSFIWRSGKFHIFADLLLHHKNKTKSKSTISARYTCTKVALALVSIHTQKTTNLNLNWLFLNDS